MESKFTADADDRRFDQLKNSDLTPKTQLMLSRQAKSQLINKPTGKCLTCMSSQALHIYVS